LLLSVIIPARNEAENLGATTRELIAAFDEAGIPHEILIVNDNSEDATQQVAEDLGSEFPSVRVIERKTLPGFGRSVRAGLAAFRGDAVVLVMADRSDRPSDVVRYYRKLEEGYDCVFGSRFRRGSVVSNYPKPKLIANRIVNTGIRLLFWTNLNDLTNAFKAFRREVILDCGPYSASHFNITIEMSLSALIRRYLIAEIPIGWSGRTWGASNLRLSEMGRRYLSALLNIFFERLLLSDDLMEERLLARAAEQDRLGGLEARVTTLELDQQQDAAAKKRTEARD
jgi:dolichol-phosphate mannosyltransferase